MGDRDLPLLFPFLRKGPVLSQGRENTAFLLLVKPRVFAISEGTSAAGSLWLGWLHGPHLGRDLSAGLFLTNQKVRWGQNKRQYR